MTASENTEVEDGARPAAAVGAEVEAATSPQAGAAVSLHIDWEARQPGVSLELAPAGEIPEWVAKPNEWVNAAVYGIRHALEASSAFPCLVRVKDISASQGLATSTTVAAAAAYAVWEIIGFEPTPEMHALIQRSVEARRKLEADPEPFRFE